MQSKIAGRIAKELTLALEWFLVMTFFFLGLFYVFCVPIIFSDFAFDVGLLEDTFSNNVSFAICSVIYIYISGSIFMALIEIIAEFEK